MRAQHVLDFARVHVESARDDELLGPADDAQVAVGVERSDVAGAEPRAVVVVGERGGVGLGSLPVAGEHVRSAEQDLAARRRGASSTPGQREADGAGAALAVVGVRHVHERLGHAVALEHVDTGRVVGSSREQRRRQRCRARHAEAERGELGVPVLMPPGGRTWSARRRRGSPPLVAQRVEHGVGLEPGHEHRRRPGEQRAVEADAEPVHVEEREREHEAVVGRPAPRQPQRLGAREQVAVREPGALGHAGRARRVAEHRVVTRARPVEPGPGSASGRPTSGPHTTTSRVGGGRHPSPHRRVVDHRRRRPAVGGDLCDLALAVGAVHRHHDEAGPQRGDVGHDQVDARRRADEDPVARRRGRPGGSRPATLRVRSSSSPPVTQPSRSASTAAGRAGRPDGGPGCGQRTATR